MWVEFFVLGGIWFWALAVLVTLVVLFSLAKDGFGWATTWIIGFLLAIHFLGDAHFVSRVLDDPLMSFWYFVGYLGIGVGWSVAKWWYVLWKIRSKYDVLKAAFLKDHNVKGNTVPDGLKKEWRKEARYARDGRLNYDWRDEDEPNIIPSLADNKGYLMCQMAYWPILIVLFFLEDFLVKIFDTLYDMFSRVYQKISDSVFRGIKDDF